MSNAGDVAEALLRVLREYVDMALESEDFWTAVASGRLKGKAEIDAKAALLESHMTPFMAYCRDEGFRYAELIEIIPMAFDTTHEEREDILNDLITHVHENYELSIPF
jgi:hypothetical protein